MKIKSKNNCTILVLLVIVCISIGYAVLNTTFNITGKTSVTKNTWNVHFENIKITEGSVTATVEPVISNDITISNFELTLDKPGDFYEFTVDVVNDGTIDAMIDSVEKTPNLTTEQQKYLNYIIEYQNGEQITTKQLVKSNEFVRLKVRVEYKKDIVSSDLPVNDESLTLGLALNYVQVDENGVMVDDNGASGVFAYGDIDEIGTIVTIGNQQFYIIGTDGDNVKLLSMYNLYVGGEYDSSLTAYGGEATGKQDSDMRGWIESSKNVKLYKGITPFSYHSTSYEGSKIKEYVDNYKTILEDDYGVDVLEARLITIEELSDSETFACTESKCSNKYPWIYSTSYWTGSSYDDNNVWCIFTTNYLNYRVYNIYNLLGVRPVIVISNDYFE